MSLLFSIGGKTYDDPAYSYVMKVVEITIAVLGFLIVSVSFFLVLLGLSPRKPAAFKYHLSVSRDVAIAILGCNTAYFVSLGLHLLSTLSDHPLACSLLHKFAIAT